MIKTPILLTFICLISILFANAQSLTYSAPFDLTASNGLTFDGDPLGLGAITPSDLAFTADGTSLFILNSQSNLVIEYSLSEPFQTTEGVMLGVSSYDVSLETNSPTGIGFDETGSRMYITGESEEKVFQYTLSSPFQISSGVSLDGSFGANLPKDIFLSPDGGKLFLLQDIANSYEIRQFTLSTPFDLLSTRTLIGSLDVTAEFPRIPVPDPPYSMMFTSNGMKLLVIGADEIRQYGLSSPFEVTSGVTYEYSFDISSEESSAKGIATNPGNTRIFVVGDDGNEVNQYSNGSDFVFEEDGTTGSVNGELIVTLSGDTFVNGPLTSPTHFSISNLPTGLIPSMTVSSSATFATLTITGTTSEWSDVGDLQFTFTDVAFSTSTAAEVSNAISASSGLGIDFSKRELIYSAPIDLNDPSTVNHDSRVFDISSQVSVPSGLTFQPDGKKMYVTGANAELYQFSLFDPFDISSVLTLDNPPLDVSSEMVFPQDIVFNDDGTRMFLLGSVDDEVNQYSLSTPFDITGGVAHNGSLDVSSEDNTPVGLAFDPAGKTLFVLGNFAKEVNQYSLTNAFDITSGVSAVTVYDISNENMSPRGISFNPSGTRMFIVSEGDDEINQYSLSTPFDLQGTVSFDDNPLNVGAEESNPTDIAFNDNGTRMYIIGLGDVEVNQYNLVSGFRETLSNTGLVEGSIDVSVAGDTFINAGSSLTVSTHYTINNIPSGLTPNLSVSANGRAATLSLTGSATENNNSDDIADLQFTFLNAAFTGNDVSIIENSVNANSGFTIDFIDQPSISYSLPVDITLTDAVTLDPGSLDIASQETVPYDLTFNPGGTKLYIVGGINPNQEMNQYSLSSPFDISTGVSFDGSVAISSVSTGIEFSADGSKLFLKRNSGALQQYNLTTPFDITNGISLSGESSDIPGNGRSAVFNSDGSRLFVITTSRFVEQYSLSASFNVINGVTFDGSFDVSTQSNVPTGLAFSPDGTKMLVSDAVSKTIYQYSLAQPFEIKSGVTYDNDPYIIPGSGMSPNGIFVDPSGENLFSIGPDQSVSPTDWNVDKFIIDLEGITESTQNNGSVNGSINLVLSNETFTNIGGTLTAPEDFSLPNLPNGLEPVISVNANGSSAILTFTSQADNHEAVNSISDLSITFENSAFLGNTASAVLNTTANTGIGVGFIDNNPPVIVSVSSTDFEENGVGTVIDVNANNGEGSANDEGVSYTLTGGDDQALFEIDMDNGQVTFISSPDFENPDDVGEDNEYTIEVTADDGGVTDNTVAQVITVTVTELNEEPAFLSSSTALFEENGTGNVLDIDADNGDGGEVDSGISFSLTGGTDQGSFTINSSNGLLTFNSSPDFENPADDNGDNDYELIVTADDGVKNSQQSITVSVTNMDENPDFISLSSVSFDENGSGTVIDIDANDGDEGLVDIGISYSLSGGADQSSFNIGVSSGILQFNESPDFEMPGDADGNNDYLVVVNASDGLNSTDQEFIISINNINDQDPVFTSISSASFTENTTGPILDVNANDGDGGISDSGITYSVSGGADQSAFSVATNGILTFSSTPDFENPGDSNQDNIYQVEVTANDGLRTSAQLITVTVLDGLDNSFPTISSQSFAIDENSMDGTEVGKVEAEDSNGDQLTFSIIDGNTGNAFSIENDGTIKVLTSAVLDFEIASEFILTIEVDDGKGGKSSGLITVSLNDLNDTPVISDQTFTIDENSTSGTVIGTVSAIDPNDVDLSYLIISGNTNDAFVIDSGSGEISVSNESEIDFERNPFFTLIIQVTNANAQISTATVSIDLNDIFEPENRIPEIEVQTFSIDEGITNGDAVGMVSATDQDGDELTFSITSGNIDNAFAFNVNNPGELLVSNSTPINLETNPSFNLTVEVNDGNGGSVSATIIINVTEVLGMGSDFAFSIYPNPGSDVLIIDHSKSLNNLTISIYDLKGKEVRKQYFGEVSDQLIIDISVLNEGSYLLLIESKDYVAQRKIHVLR